MALLSRPRTVMFVFGEKPIGSEEATLAPGSMDASWKAVAIGACLK